MEHQEYEMLDYRRIKGFWVRGWDDHTRISTLNYMSKNGYGLIESEVIDGYLYETFKRRPS